MKEDWWEDEITEWIFRQDWLDLLMAFKVNIFQSISWLNSGAKKIPAMKVGKRNQHSCMKKALAIVYLALQID